MKVGTAQLDITPQPGVDLAGFAVRPQPSTAILDPLWIRALYVEEGRERFLWLHADLLAFEQSLADRLRLSLAEQFGLALSQVLVSTTHTHSGPATIQLTGCGEVSSAFITYLEERVAAAARLALLNVEPCRLLTAQGNCTLGVDRRGSASAHTDPRVGAVAWQRRDGTYKAAFVDYAMHPVCLRSSMISGDWPGEVARLVAEALPGAPVTLVASGACGNINPPGVGVTPQQVREWSQTVAESVLPRLLESGKEQTPQDGRFRIANATIDLPLEEWDSREIERYAAACLADTSGHDEFGDRFALAVEVWRAHMTDRFQRGDPPHTRVELTALLLGQISILTLNAEIFSRFTGLAGTGVEGPVYTVNCANGMIGYVPTAEAYEEGTYEVLWSMLFYNLPRPRKGGLELLAERANSLIADLQYTT